MHGSRLLTGAGYLLRVPSIDWPRSALGAARWSGSIRALAPVGPRSAGAAPGPLCYDLGGTEPDDTDANVIWAISNPARLAGGAVKPQRGAGARVFEETVARPLGMPLVGRPTAPTHRRLEHDARHPRRLERAGRDPASTLSFAFGGNGPLFAAGMGEQLEMRRIVVPPAPGPLLVVRLLYADVEHHYVGPGAGWCARPTPRRSAISCAAWRRAPRSARHEGFHDTRVRLRRSADCRYQGQSFERTVR